MATVTAESRLGLTWDTCADDRDKIRRSYDECAEPSHVCAGQIGAVWEG